MVEMLYHTVAGGIVSFFGLGLIFFPLVAAARGVCIRCCIIAVGIFSCVEKKTYGVELMIRSVFLWCCIGACVIKNGFESREGVGEFDSMEVT